MTVSKKYFFLFIISLNTNKKLSEKINLKKFLKPDDLAFKKRSLNLKEILSDILFANFKNL